MFSTLMTCKSAESILSKMDTQNSLSDDERKLIFKKVKFKHLDKTLNRPFYKFVFMKGSYESIYNIVDILALSDLSKLSDVYLFFENLKYRKNPLDSNLLEYIFIKLLSSKVLSNIKSYENDILIPYFIFHMNKLNIVYQKVLLALINKVEYKLPLISLFEQRDERLNYIILQYILSIYDSLDIPIHAVSFEQKEGCLKLIHLVNDYGNYKDVKLIYNHYNDNNIVLTRSDVKNKPDFIYVNYIIR